jgi:hypothetical protein
MRGGDRVINAEHAMARAEEEAHRARIVRELHRCVAELTESLMPPDMREAGLRLAYKSEDIT